ncbi:MAG: diguanylate cyclase, partial [Cyanobacteria bacterium]|nr:diguanylate cyclase [Cyanobacteriota bacterium]
LRNQQELLTASRKDSLNDFRAQQALQENGEWFHLAGKYEIERKLRYELQRAKRYKRYLALLVAKIDRQEQLEEQLSSLILNDLFALLAEVAHGTMRDIDTIGRPSRDFLAICCPETDVESACHAARRLKEALYQLPARPLFGGARLTLSIGVAVAPDHAKDEEGLIRSAVDACLAATASGGNRIFTANKERVPEHDSGGKSKHIGNLYDVRPC